MGANLPLNSLDWVSASWYTVTFCIWSQNLAFIPSTSFFQSSTSIPRCNCPKVNDYQSRLLLLAIPGSSQNLSFYVSTKGPKFLSSGMKVTTFPLELLLSMGWPRSRGIQFPGREKICFLSADHHDAIALLEWPSSYDNLTVSITTLNHGLIWFPWSLLFNTSPATCKRASSSSFRQDHLACLLSPLDSTERRFPIQSKAFESPTPTPTKSLQFN